MPEPFRFNPKELFLADERTRETHNNYAASTVAQQALNASLSEMAMRQVAQDAIVRSHNASKIEGAKEFVAIWLNIGRPVNLPPEREMQSLKPV